MSDVSEKLISKVMDSLLTGIDLQKNLIIANLHFEKIHITTRIEDRRLKYEVAGRDTDGNVTGLAHLVPLSLLDAENDYKFL